MLHVKEVFLKQVINDCTQFPLCSLRADIRGVWCSCRFQFDALDRTEAVKHVAIPPVEKCWPLVVHNSPHILFLVVLRGL